MDSESWLEKAERLRTILESLDRAAGLSVEDVAARESITIALWLRHEFSEEHVPSR